jgi:protocatechuate 3,4-dioxygenase beta subunit
MERRLSRRDALLRSAAAGALRVAPWLGLSEAVSAIEAQEVGAASKATQWNEIGPFYKRLAPNQPQMRTANDAGLPLTVSGTVISTRGDALARAKIEIWQADHHGLYDLEGYRFRAALESDVKGNYGFDTVMPGHYPARVCQHIHYLVTAPGHKPLITQLYFATDPVFEGDPEHNYARDPLVLSRDLVRPVLLTGDPQAIEAKVRFELVLERL